MGAQTATKSSRPLNAGLSMRSSERIVLEEGGPAKNIQVTSTIPIMCQDSFPSSSECCLELEATVASGSLHCPDGSDMEDRIEVGRGGCRPKVCREDFNRTVSIPIRVRDDHLVSGDDEVIVRFRVADDSGLWDHVKIPDQKVRVIASKITESCSVESVHPSPIVNTFDASELNLSQAGIYTLYRHATLPIEVQAHFRPCSLGELCTCAIGVRVDDVITVLDVCTKGYMQVWSWTQSGRVPKEEDRLPEGFEIVSIDEGREYKVSIETNHCHSTISLFIAIISIEDPC